MQKLLQAMTPPPSFLFGLLHFIFLKLLCKVKENFSLQLCTLKSVFRPNKKFGKLPDTCERLTQSGLKLDLRMQGASLRRLKFQPILFGDF